MPKVSTSNGEAPAPAEATLGGKRGRREKVYPALMAAWYLEEGLANAPEVYLKPLQVEDSKRMLGWQEEPPGENWKQGEYAVRDCEGKKVRLLHNRHNRPIERNWVMSLAQEHLTRKWRVNGETVTIGEYGNVLSAQHRLLGHVFAEQIRLQNPSLWKGYWKTPVTMQTLVVYGVPESDDVVNTIDTGRPRSVADVVFRSGDFAEYRPSERKQMSRMVEWAVKLLWERTAARHDPHTTHQTNSESLDFLHRHRRLLDAVKTVHEIDKASRGVLRLYLTPGYASGLLYLMGTSSSPPESYYGGKVRNERHLLWDRWDPAVTFWESLVLRTETMEPVRQALARLGGDDGTGAGRRAEREAVLIRAWAQYRDGRKIREKDLHLHYELNARGMTELADFPLCGGIDLGPKRAQDMADEVD